MNFKMRHNICFRLHFKQLVKVALLLSILWLAISSIWDHWKRRVDVPRIVTEVTFVAGEVSQTQLDYISSNLRIHYQLIQNEEKTFTAEVTLINSGNRTIEPCCWSIIFYHFNLLHARNMRKDASLSRQSFFHDDSIAKLESSDSGFEIIHLNGNTYRLNVLKGFGGFKPKEEVTVTLKGQRWLVSRSHILPKWYVASDDPAVNPRLLASTINENLEFVGSFEADDQILRSSKDMLRPFDPEKRFEMNAVGKDLRGGLRGVLPTPLLERFRPQSKELLLESSLWSISFAKGLENEALYLKDRLEIESIEEIKDEDRVNLCSSRTIFLSINAGLPLGNVTQKIKSTSEAYRLTIDPDKECISIIGVSSAGVFYGAVSLLSLAKKPTRAESFALGGELNDGPSFRGVEIIDGPRFKHRGLMIDVARNFRSKDEIIRLIDLISLYKMNKLHLHLTDDEGWRLEIPGLEELTQFGGRRGHDPSERFHLMSMLGSGPFTNSSGSGFYSRTIYRDILRHARSRHVEVIPEFDMPGHSHAAVRSMERRRARLTSEGHETQANDYVLFDPLDRSEYLSAQFFFDGVMNPCLDSTYRFVNHVVAEVVRMHKDIQPLNLFHFGGDEVPSGVYVNSPACKDFIAGHPSLAGPKDLKRHFVRQVAAIVAHHGAAVEGWEDAFSDSTGKPLPLSQMKAKEVVSQAWYNIWERGYAHRAYEYANNGYKVILTPATAVYFDNPQEPDPEDWGLHWATRYIDTRRTFFFAPDSLYDNIDFDFFGKRISKQEMCGTKKIECPELKSPQNIIGLEAALWSEVVRTSDHMESLLFPRLLAVAERSWHKANWESMKVNCDDDADQCPKRSAQRNARASGWTAFANTVGYKELRRLEDLGVNYYLPRPGARVVEGRLEVNTLFPGLMVETSLDGGRSWVDFRRNSTYKGNILLATRSFDGKRRSLPVQMKVI